MQPGTIYMLKLEFGTSNNIGIHRIEADKYSADGVRSHSSTILETPVDFEPLVHEYESEIPLTYYRNESANC